MVWNTEIVNQVIFPYFTMRKFETDEAGCLYDPGARRFLRDTPAAQRHALEALGAFGLAGKLMHLHMQRWAEQHDLSEGRLRILSQLRINGDTAMTRLADALHTTPRNVTGLVDHLEKDGFVERVPDPTDRRSVLARLTESGRAKIADIWRAGLTRQMDLTSGFTEEELRQLRHLCLRLAGRMDAIGGTDDR